MKQKKFYLAIFFLAFVFLASPSISLAEGVCFRPEFPIPGFPLDPSGDCKGGMILSSQGDAIGIYINALYKYGAGLAGLMAMFMIVFASWQWIMASGNAGKIDNAKDTIRGALLGLTLLFAGNLLLSNITNRLVKFENLELPSIETKRLANLNCEALTASCGTITPMASGDCVGQQCPGGQTCMEIGVSWTGNTCSNLKEDIGAGMTCSCKLPDNQLNCALWRGMNHVCSAYPTESTCNTNLCGLEAGPCLWEPDSDGGGSCHQVDDVSCDTDDDCGVVTNTNGDVVDTCCDTDDIVNNCEFPVEYRLAHPDQFPETDSPQADNCGD